MSVVRPYRRTIRQFVDGTYAGNAGIDYINHHLFASYPEHYVRAFIIIQKDLVELFDYIEPADGNMGAYSYRIHEMFMRTCIEVEANFKAILAENGYARSGRWDMRDYSKCEASHFLSSYEVKLPVWQGTQHTHRPYAAWARGGTLPWYDDYNAAKHSRHRSFEKASFSNLLDSICGLVALLSAQFYTEDFSPHPSVLVRDHSPSDFKSAIGGYFRVKFPNCLPVAQQYDFNWLAIQSDPDPFHNYPY